MPIVFRKIFKEIPPDCQLKAFVQLTGGHVQCEVWVVDSDPATPDQNWFNDSLLRTPTHPDAVGSAPIVGPAGCVLLANLIVAQNETKGKMVLSVVNQNDEEIRNEIWSFGDEDGLDQMEVINGVLLVQLA